eukprot:Gb_14829 [translate_table: standard]
MYFIAVNANESPWESSNPLITGRGIKRYIRPIKPVTLSKNRVLAMQIPTAIISGMLRCFPSLIATATMDFMGCIGIGTPKSRPVVMLYNPVNIRVVTQSNAFTNAIDSQSSTSLDNSNFIGVIYRRRSLAVCRLDRLLPLQVVLEIQQ